MVVQGQVNTAV